MNITNNKSNFAQLFINSSNVLIINVRCLKFTLYLNRVFTTSVFTSCSNTQSKSVAKWHNCHINELVKQIILYRPQNGLLARIPRNNVGQLWHVSLIVFQHNIPHMIIDWHIDLGHLLLFLHQNRCVVICMFCFFHLTFYFIVVQLLANFVESSRCIVVGVKYD